MQLDESVRSQGAYIHQKEKIGHILVAQVFKHIAC